MSAVKERIAELEHLIPDIRIRQNVPLGRYTTLRAGGAARWFFATNDLDCLAEVSTAAQILDIPHLIIGSGSNLLPSDRGVGGLVIVNACAKINLDGAAYAECGCWFQDLFLRAAQRGFAGLEFAVGIPGTLGGALVSNAGAYRANIGELLEEIEIVRDGKRFWVKPDYLEFSYRDSILRRPNPPAITLLAVRLNLQQGDAKHIYDLAREYQRQRIKKQPPHPSAGSFFKNVYDSEFAERFSDLPEKLREAGVVPAGYLIERCGLKGALSGRSIVSQKHANYICNLGGAKASEIRSLAERVIAEVCAQFGVALEEEVLYVGDWSLSG